MAAILGVGCAQQGDRGFATFPWFGSGAAKDLDEGGAPGEPVSTENVTNSVAEDFSAAAAGVQGTGTDHVDFANTVLDTLHQAEAMAQLAAVDNSWWLTGKLIQGMCYVTDAAGIPWCAPRVCPAHEHASCICVVTSLGSRTSRFKGYTNPLASQLLDPFPRGLSDLMAWQPSWPPARDRSRYFDELQLISMLRGSQFSSVRCHCADLPSVDTRVSLCINKVPLFHKSACGTRNPPQPSASGCSNQAPQQPPPD